MINDKALFAAGCFWGVEEIFSSIQGVVSTCVGYSGGIKENPIYEEVCSDSTQHAESVLVNYNPKIITYSNLLESRKVKVIGFGKWKNYSFDEI